MKNTQEKLTQLRAQMQQHGVDYYFVPSTDPHNNEYVPPCWQRRAWISGFTGSAGDVLVGLEHAYLWTDGRYTLQANHELDLAHFTLMPQQQGMAPIDQWLAENAPGKTVGFDPTVLSATHARLWEATLARVDSTLKPIEENLVDAVWSDRPKLNSQPIHLWPEKHAGASVNEKIETLRERMKTESVDAYAITALDAIAWLYNIRGSDILFNPVVISYALVTTDEAFLFIDDNKVPEDARTYLQSQNITLKPYEAFGPTLQALKGRVFLESGIGSAWTAQQLQQASIINAPSLINQLKSVKNATELSGMQEAHRQDAVALCRFLHWLENNWQGETEISVADHLEALRREAEDCRGLSFPTIAGFADHGAIAHYFAIAETDYEINDRHLFLIDSGAQYWQGTTDVTRTVHLGTPTDEEKYHYTLTLKAHLALRQTVFPQGTTGEQLNTIAKREIWKAKMDYNHGTGHGVGCYLCVHEGPHRISDAKTGVSLEPGMIVSNEPGLYIEGLHGIRVENLCAITLVEEAPTRTGHGPFYGFSDLTLAPHARKLIDLEMLTTDEVAYLNKYHQRVYDTLSDSLAPEVRDWLAEATAPLA